LKPHRSVQQIAKKHRLDVSFIQKQLDMGEPIEHEHTKDHTLAMDIALQHLDEIPDYYTRLKKMEASAKKEHKKFKDVVKEDAGNDDMDSPIHIPPTNGVHIEYDKRYCPKCKKVQTRSECKYGPTCWDIFSIPAKLKEEVMKKEKRYCPLCDKRETRSECSYGEKAWDKVSVKDHEYSMARSELDTLMKAAQRIKKKVGKGEGNLEAWVQSKITKAADYIDTAADYIDSGEMEEAANPAQQAAIAISKKKRLKSESVSFEVNSKDLRTSKRSTGIRNLSQKGATEGERTAAQNKRTEPQLISGRKVPGLQTQQIKNIHAEFEPRLVDKILAELEEGNKKGLWDNIHARREKGLPRKKPGQKGYPKTLDIDEDLAQARKNVGANKCWPNKKVNPNKPTKMKGGTEVPNCVPAESVTIEDANGNLYAEVVDLIKPEPMASPKSTFMANNELEEATRLQSETGNIIAVILSWRGKTYSIRMFFPQVGMPSKKDVTSEIQKVYPSAIVLQYNVSTIQPGMPLIQVVNSKSKNYLLNNGTIGEENIEEEGPVLSVGRGEKLSVKRGGGLTQKGRDKYNHATGSHLQAPVTGKVKPGSKAAQRRKAFCSRSRSWHGERGLAARRRWKC